MMPNNFLKWLYLIILWPIVLQMFHLLFILTNNLVLSVCTFNNSFGIIMVYHCGFHLFQLWCGWAPFPNIYWPCGNHLLLKYLYRSFVYFSIGLYVFIDVLELYILKISPFVFTVCNFSHSVLAFYSVSDVINEHNFFILMKSNLLVFSSVVSALYTLWNLSSPTNHEDTFLHSLLEILFYLLLLELWPNWQWRFCNSW